MRLLLAGILHLALASVVLAQANGDIESLGFEFNYRPGCWTPMVVRLTPTSGATFKGKIAVYQEDADHDHPIFTRPIALRGNAEGSGDRTQRFWMYFIPQPDLTRDGGSPTDVNRKLLVYLTAEDGKQLARLPVKDQIAQLDDANNPRSTRLVLYVTDRSKPILAPFAPQNMGGGSVIGLKEPVLPVPIPIRSVRNLLPESVLGYESVDAVVWLDADPETLSSDQKTALKEYVARGGKLIVCQTGAANAWQFVKASFLGPMLPVDVQAIEKTDNLAPLKRIVADRLAFAPTDRAKFIQWKDVGAPPYDYAIAKPRPGAIVAETEGKDAVGRPYLVRGAFGSGTVTWVAQDLGDENLTGHNGVAGTSAANEDFKWLYIWDRVFDWANASQPARGLNANEPDKARRDYYARYSEGNDSVYHLTHSFLGGMEFPGTGAAYLGLAVLFFLIYWIAAGPGSYLYLAGKKRAGMSWFAFAAAALLATGVTVIIVKLVLRGSAQIHHVTFVRQTPGEPTQAYSQFGLYIPRDGGQRVELKKTMPDAVSYVTAYPTLTAGDEGAPPIEYEVPVSDPRAITFPYRSTLKKLQARWVGDMPLGVEGGARISKANETNLEGKLVNKTGHKLKNVYVVFRPRFIATADTGVTSTQDQVLFVSTWDVGATLDLTAEFAGKKYLGLGSNSPEGSGTVRGTIGTPGVFRNGAWDRYFYERFQRDTEFKDQSTVPGNFFLLSLFDRVPPPSFEQGDRYRWDLHRAALRQLDVSGAISAGQLVILAETDANTPLPVPVEVEGDPVAGEGVTFYQFILPLDRSALIAAPAAPATKPVGATP